MTWGDIVTIVLLVVVVGQLGEILDTLKKGRR